MKTLKFRRTGHYLDELSARYIAEFTTGVFVGVFKCAYSKEWRASFSDRINYTMDINGDLDYYASTKKEMVQWLNEDAANAEFCERLRQLSEKAANRHNEWLLKNGKEPINDYKLY